MRWDSIIPGFVNIHHVKGLKVLEVVAVLRAVEAGAGFVDALQLAVAQDVGIGVVYLQAAEQGDEGSTLGRGAGVGGAALLVESAFVADADGMGIVVAGVHTHLGLVAGLVHLTVTLDVVVIAYALVVETGVVTGTEHFDGEALVAARGAAVNDNEIDLSHSFVLLTYNFERRGCRRWW